MLKKINWKTFSITAITYLLVNLVITYLFAEPVATGSIFTVRSLLIKLFSALIFALAFELFFRNRVRKTSNGNTGN